MIVSKPYAHGIFTVTGVEIEYMLVNRDTLAVMPIADKILRDLAGQHAADVELGPVTWSNELVRHVIELKTTLPAFDLDLVRSQFNESIGVVNSLLADKYNALLLPTGMHPLINPHEETWLWPHENGEIYALYDRIFDCRTHGWSNLQSMHVNLPFANEEEFGRLHTAIRTLLPLLPALAASSPLVEGRRSGFADTRLHFYRQNSFKIPLMTGAVIPEAVFTLDQYYDRVLHPLFRQIELHDTSGTMQHEWVNSRGAIARFDRGSIEIRVLDSQECVSADLAVAWLVTTVLKTLACEDHHSQKRQRELEMSTLVTIFLEAVNAGHKAVIRDSNYLAVLGVSDSGALTAKEVWLHFLEQAEESSASVQHAEIARRIIESGCLASRILESIEAENQTGILAVYKELAACLAEDRLFNTAV